MEQLKQFVSEGKGRETADKVRVMLDEGMSPDQIMKEGMIPAMDDVGAKFQEGEIYLPEMLVAARAMKAGMEVLAPYIKGDGIKPVGTAVMGTSRGDMHDIGKNLAIMSLEGAGFKVVDLGTDVPPERFVEAIREHSPLVVGMSALLTTTMLEMRTAIDAIAEAGLRDTVKIMVGGAPVTQDFADEIGAEFYAPDSTAGKNWARQMAVSTG